VWLYVFWLRQPCGIALLNEVENIERRALVKKKRKEKDEAEQ
jgi:hypothetical protein